MRVLLATNCVPGNRKTVAAIRALASHGIEVTVGGDRFWGQAYHSRFCRRRIRCPHPSRDAAGFIDALIVYLSNHRHDVLLPMGDSATIAVAEAQQQLEPYVALCIPSPAAVHRCLDKYEVHMLARRLGIETPNTFQIRRGEDLLKLAGAVGYPCVVKLRRGAGAVGLCFPDSAQQLRQVVEARRPKADGVFDYDHLLLQEYIPGEIHDACLLFDRGRVRASLTQQRHRMYPRRGGVGTIVETTVRPDLIERAVALLEELKWHGPAQVEFTIDKRDGCVRLLEINGRFWGSLDLAIQAGIDFPYLACRLALQDDVETVVDYRRGLRYRWSLPFGVLDLLDRASPASSLWDFWRPGSGAISDLWLTDPLPPLAELAYILRRLPGRFFHKRRR